MGMILGNGKESHFPRISLADVKTYRPCVYLSCVTNFVGLPRRNTPQELEEPQGEVGGRLVVSPRFIDMGHGRVMKEATFEEA